MPIADLARDIQRILLRRGTLYVRSHEEGGSYQQAGVIAETVLRGRPIVKAPDEFGHEEQVGVEIAIEGNLLQTEVARDFVSAATALVTQPVDLALLSRPAREAELSEADVAARAEMILGRQHLAIGMLLHYARGESYLPFRAKATFGMDEVGLFLTGGSPGEGFGLEVLPCNSSVSSGGQGDTTTLHHIGGFPGWVRLDYEMFTIPDQAQLIYDGSVVADTGDLVSGQGSLHWYYPADEGAPETIAVRVYAPENNTAWNYTLRCPDPANAP